MLFLYCIHNKFLIVVLDVLVVLLSAHLLFKQLWSFDANYEHARVSDLDACLFWLWNGAGIILIGSRSYARNLDE